MDKFNWQQTFDSEHRFCSWSAPSQKQAQRQVNMPKHLICREYFGEGFEFISSPLFAQKNHSLSTGKLKGNGAKCSCWTKGWPYEVSSHGFRGSSRESLPHGPPRTGLHFVTEHQWFNGCILPWAWIPVAMNISSGKHQFLLHKRWCKTQGGAHSHLMPFQSTISLM